ncbi:DUF4123 domain-containing protein [Paracoccus xiamenensis]|uniref:DUF4123 domain-containing protein n=1 Tax=Paracoccus xiamenensis TaxID=2714901 RepID=UPI001409A1E5|nr:DUF4123 domain-containing protein [Paracoccus xiamenensis]NHF72988.1 DUF4123 domain-containing protein [Paracoccus xiamenensis]
MSGDWFDDVWQASHDATSPAVSAAPRFLTFQQINGIEPPGDDMGVVPAALADILFPPDQDGVHNYALLDAARIPSLPETLETSRLDHVCLFRGASFEQMKPVAPWLVRLNDSGKFTRNLFRASTRPWHLWDKGAGIFIRSAAPLEELCAHLRRFTKVSDSAGKWVFFRFWDPLVAQIYFGGMADHPERIGQIFTTPSGQRIEMIVQTGPQQMLRMTPSAVLPPSQPRRAVTFEAADMALLAEVSYRALSRQIAQWLAQEYPGDLADRSATQMQAIGAHVVATGRWLGLTMKQDFAFLAQMMMTSGGWFLHDGTLPAMHPLIAAGPAPRAGAMAAAYADLQAQSPQAELLGQWSDLRGHLAELPDDQVLTQNRLHDLIQTFLPKTARQVPLALASTRRRLKDFALLEEITEGRAMLLALLFGPRFFEDPFKPWAQSDPEAAIAAAWRILTE